MPNIAAALKAEIARVARKEIRAQISGLQSSFSRYRSQIAALRKQVESLEKTIAKQARWARIVKPTVGEEQESTHRFSAKGFAGHRKRLGLSAAEMARLLGVSQLSVYKWESGKTRPRAKQIETIAAIRSMGRREARAKLDQDTEESAATPRRRRQKA